MHSLLRRRDDRGETLVEVLVALTILGLAALAILAGVQLVTKTSDIHRKATTGGAYVRTFAEAIQRHVATTGSDNYIKCAGQDAYKASALALFTLPPGLTAASFHQAPAETLNGAGVVTSCADDNGAQRLVLSVDSPDGKVSETLTIVLRRTCLTSPPC